MSVLFCRQILTTTFIQQMYKWIIKDLLFSFSSVHVNAGYTLMVYQMACLNVYGNKSLVD